MTKLPIMRAATVILAGGLLAGTLSSCAATDTSDAPKLTYWASNQGRTLDDDQRILGESLARFTEATGVEVELEVIPWSDMYNRMLTAVSSGEGPDVINVGNTWSVGIQDTGSFVSFDEDAAEQIGGLDRFVDANLSATGAAGKPPAALPLYGLAYSLYYNASVFEAAGLEPPQTWEEMVDIAHQLTVDTDGDGQIDQWGLSITGNRPVANTHMAFALGLRHGSELYDDEGNPTFTDDGIVKATMQWIDLMASGVVDPAVAEYDTVAQVQDDLMLGRAAMIIDQNPHNAFAARDFTDWANIALPSFETLPAGGIDIATHVSGINVAVFKNSDNLDAALALAKFLTDDEQVFLASSYGLLPVDRTAADAPEFDEEWIKVKQETLENHSAPMPLYSSEGQAEILIGQAIGQLFGKIAVGGTVTEADVREALESAQASLAK